MGQSRNILKETSDHRPELDRGLLLNEFNVWDFQFNFVSNLVALGSDCEVKSQVLVFEAITLFNALGFYLLTWIERLGLLGRAWNADVRAQQADGLFSLPTFYV